MIQHKYLVTLLKLFIKYAHIRPNLQYMSTQILYNDWRQPRLDVNSNYSVFFLLLSLFSISLFALFLSRLTHTYTSVFVERLLCFRALH